MYRPSQEQTQAQEQILANYILLIGQNQLFYLLAQDGTLFRFRNNNISGIDASDRNIRVLTDLSQKTYTFHGNRLSPAPVSFGVPPSAQAALPFGTATGPQSPRSSNSTQPAAVPPLFGSTTNGSSTDFIAQRFGTMALPSVQSGLSVQREGRAPDSALVVNEPSSAEHLVVARSHQRDERRPLLLGENHSGGNSPPTGGRWCGGFLSSHSIDNTMGMLIGGGLAIINHLVLMSSDNKLSLSGLSFSFMACFIAGFVLGNLSAYEIRKRAANKEWCPVTSEDGIRKYYCGNLFATPKPEVLFGIGSGVVSSYFAYFHFLSGHYNDTLFGGSIAATIGFACALAGNRGLSFLRDHSWFLQPNAGSEVCTKTNPYCEDTVLKPVGQCARSSLC